MFQETKVYGIPEEEEGAVEDDVPIKVRRWNEARRTPSLGKRWSTSTH